MHRRTHGPFCARHCRPQAAGIIRHTLCAWAARPTGGPAALSMTTPRNPLGQLAQFSARMSNLTDMVDPDPDALTRKGRATRDRIITCAAELILAGGFSRLSIESIRKAASVSGSQMTHYFPGRDTLIRAVIAHQTQVVLDFHRQPALGGLDTFEDFDRWAALTLRFGRRNTRTGPVPTYGALICEAISDQA